MNLATELMNRRGCRHNLDEVLVAVDDTGPAVPVLWTAWDINSRLVVHLADGRAFPPERLWLRSVWTWGCCRPSRPNPWNPHESRRRGHTSRRRLA